jgi:hypothetical protein
MLDCTSTESTLTCNSHCLLETLKAILLRVRESFASVASSAGPCRMIALNVHLDFLPLYASVSAVKSTYLFAYILARHGHLREVYLWLSTLGAAHFALGSAITRHAVDAEAMSLRQARVAALLGDAALHARCILFYGVARGLLGELWPLEVR